MPKKPRGQTPIEEQLADFEAGVPKNLGNFPDELDPIRPANAPQRAESPEPAPEPEPEEEAAPAIEPEQAEEPERREPPSEADRLAALEEQLQARTRELDFLRAGYQQGAATTPAATAGVPGQQDVVQLIDNYLGGNGITADDWQQMLQDPTKGATWAQNALRLAVAAGARIAMDQLRTEFAQYQTQQQGATALRDQYYAANPQHGKYAKLVQMTATEVRGQYPNITNDALVKETAQRVNGQLKEWGVKPERETAPRQASQRVRPAFGDMGGGGGGGGRGRALSPVEKQLRQFEAESQRYMG